MISRAGSESAPNLAALGLTSIRKRDSSTTRRKLFAALIAKKRLVRAAYRVFESARWRPAVSAALLAYSLRRLLQARLRLGGPRAEIKVYHFLNERRAIERVSTDAAAGAIWYESWPSAASLGRLLPFPLRKTRQWARVSMRLLARNGFLIGARQAEFLLLYGFYARLFAARGIRGRAFISASESAPEIISATLAAKREGNRTIFVNHNALERELGTFFHDDIHVPGAAFVEKIRPHLMERFSPPRIFISRSSERRPSLRLPGFDRVRRIGIVCSVITTPDRLSHAIKECLRVFPGAEIVVRPHPNESIARVLRSSLPDSPLVRLQVARPFVPIATAARDWDFAIIGNSSSHLEALAAGVPTVYLDLDGLDDDLFDFARAGLIPAAESVNDLSARMAEVYSQPGWNKIYRRYDESLELGDDRGC